MHVQLHGMGVSETHTMINKMAATKVVQLEDASTVSDLRTKSTLH